MRGRSVRRRIVVITGTIALASLPGACGVVGNNGSNWVDVEAGGSNNGPTYWEVCSGPSAQSVNDCQDVADHNSSSKQS